MEMCHASENTLPVERYTVQELRQDGCDMHVMLGSESHRAYLHNDLHAQMPTYMPQQFYIDPYLHPCLPPCHLSTFLSLAPHTCNVHT